MQITLCETCVFYVGNLACYAFPTGIPAQILDGRNDHSTPTSKQTNRLIYTERTGKVTKAADALIASVKKPRNAQKRDAVG